MSSDVLVVGNPFDGMTIIGPFDHPEDASSYAEKFCGGEDWHLIPVEEPDPAFDNWDKLPDDHLYRDGDNPAVEEVLEVDDNDDNPAVEEVLEAANGCRETVCWCHDQTIDDKPAFCNFCGCHS